MSTFNFSLSAERAHKRLAYRERAREAGTNVRRRRIPRYALKSLPLEAREALYNIDVATSVDTVHEVPGDQLAFYCFNYGRPRAVSFAAGLPASCLKAAKLRPGWRPKSRALLVAVMNYRGIT